LTTANNNNYSCCHSIAAGESQALLEPQQSIFLAQLKSLALFRSENNFKRMLNSVLPFL